MNSKDLLGDLQKIGDKYSMSLDELGRFLRSNDISIPFSIFNDRLGSFESIVKYMKEDMGLSIKSISGLSGRKPQAVLTTYRRSQAKFPERFSLGSSESFPLSIIRDSKRSVLQALVAYLARSSRPVSEIASTLHRDYKTIWTVRSSIR